MPRSRLAAALLMLLGLVPFGAADDAAAVRWTRVAEIRDDGDLSLETPWDPVTGISLCLAAPDHAGIRIALGTPEGSGIDAFAPPRNPYASHHARVFADALPARPRPEATLLIKVRPEVWLLYLDGLLCAHLPPPFDPPLSVLRPTAELPTEPAAPRFQKTARTIIADDFTHTPDAPSPLTRWESVSGQWKIHTVMEDAVEQKSSDRLDSRPMRPDFSPNFHALTGSGSPGLLLRGHPFYDRYRVSAAIHLPPRPEAAEYGLVAHHRGPDDYYLFKLVTRAAGTPCRLELWRHAANRVPRAVRLAAASVDLTPDQWVRPEIRVAHRSITCLVDQTTAFQVAVDTSPGGRFGLYVHSETPVRIDDVCMESLDTLPLDTVGDLRFHTFADANRPFDPENALAPADPESPQLTIPASPEPTWLMLGSPRHPPHVFAATFTDLPAPHTVTRPVGLLIGCQGPRDAMLRFTWQRRPGGERIQLSRAAGSMHHPIRTVDIAGAPVASEAAVRLMADATVAGELRLYRNGNLVLIHHLPHPLTGGSGIFIGPDTGAEVSDLHYAFRRNDIRRSKYEKNDAYVEDPFMRHWSSPEGEWTDDEEGLTWNKSDFFGRFELLLPVVSGSAVYPAVPEERIRGALAITVEGRRVALQRLGDGGEPAAELATATLGPTGDTGHDHWQLHYEGYWLWATQGDRLLWTHGLQRPFRDTRLRIHGFDQNQRARTRVTRYKVQDFLFHRAPTEWLTNGGTWQIINRFQCDPRWSHMNGESAEGLASIWSRYRYSGDFCVEAYAGIRHGWYHRCGDINLTIMNRDISPDSGYSVLTTGWDHHHSQKWTRLFRDGERIGRSADYLLPRFRDDNKRRTRRDPLIRGGRDVHGAWYHLKLRRRGKRLQFFFDGHKVFDVIDDDPLEDGSFGLWTYRNSIVVARIKVAAESIAPRHHRITPLPLRRPAAERPPAYARLTDSDDELHHMEPHWWELGDSVGHPQLEWWDQRRTGRAFTVINTCGGGAMHARCKADPVPFPDIAGWRFRVARTADARINFHYSLGRRDDDGTYVPKHHYFHRLSGTDFDRGPHRLHGATSVPAADPRKWPARPRIRPDDPLRWLERVRWHPVTVWLPLDEHRQSLNDPALLVRVEGFGALQADDIQQGIGGNGPHHGYAVFQFHPIRRRPPVISVPSSVRSPDAFVVFDRDSIRPKLNTASFQRLNSWLREQAEEQPGTPFHHLVLRALGPGTAVSETELSWVPQPARPRLSWRWSETIPDAICFGTPGDIPCRALPAATLTVDGRALPHRRQRPGLRIAELADAAISRPRNRDSLDLKLTLPDGTDIFHSLRWSRRPLPGRPRLVALDRLTLFNHEDNRLPAPVTTSAERTRILRHIPDQGSAIEVRNTDSGQRLEFAYRPADAFSTHPLLQFHYRAEETAAISLSFGAAGDARLNEPSKGTPVRGGTAFHTDDRWHTWTGFIADALETPATRFRSGRVRFASISKKDRTGRYTRMLLDDIAHGPAVRSGHQLQFTPTYFATDGIDRVDMALHAGVADYRQMSADVRDALQWLPIRNRAPAVPVIDELPEGIAHLLLRAHGANGRQSLVTDIPFLIDRTPLEVGHTFVASDQPGANGSLLRLEFRNPGHGAPVQLGQLRWRIDDTRYRTKQLDPAIRHRPEATTIDIPYAKVLRTRLNALPRGDAIRLRVTAIADGAGTPSPDLDIAITSDWQSDRTGPDWLEAALPDTCRWFLPNAGSGNGQAPWSATEEFSRHTADDTLNVHLIATLRRGNLSDAIAVSCDLPPGLRFRCRLRRPKPPDRDPGRILLRVTTLSPRGHLDIPLDRSVKDEKPHPDVNGIRWRNAGWHTAAVDLYEACHRHHGSKLTKRTRITHLRLLLRGGSQDREVIHLADPFLYTPWTARDTVALDGCDRSGVAGMHWTALDAADQPLRQGDSPTLRCTPAELDLPAEAAWLQLRLTDRPGNRSAPRRLPL